MLYVFGHYTLDTARHELRHHDRAVPLEPKGYQVLLYLVEQRAHLVTREELLEHVWPEVYITDTTVARCLTLVRKAVGDSGMAQRVIKTLHGQGYRFVAPVTVHTELPSEVPVSPTATPSPPETAEGRRCRACQQPNPVSAQFCITCGAALEVTCAHCGQAIAVPATFCPRCGQRLASPAPSLPLQPPYTSPSAVPQVDTLPPSAPRPPPASEHKLVTVLSGIVSPALSFLPGLDLDDRHARWEAGGTDTGCGAGLYGHPPAPGE